MVPTPTMKMDSKNQGIDLPETLSPPSQPLPSWLADLTSRTLSGRSLPSDRYFLDPTLIMSEAGMSPDPWQERVLRSMADRLLLCCSRQFGKSAVVGALVALTAILRPPATCLLLSASQRQSGEFFKKHVVSLFRKLKWPIKPVSKPNVLSLELVNGSRVIALPDNEEAIVGYSDITLLVIDEAARVSDELFHYTTPFLAVSGGRLICMSTPKGKRGWFHDAWSSGSGWERHQALAPPLGEGCPRITPEFLAKELRDKGPRLYAQEYLGEFNEVLDAAFPYADIQAAMVDGGIPLFSGDEYGDPW